MQAQVGASQIEPESEEPSGAELAKNHCLRGLESLGDVEGAGQGWNSKRRPPRRQSPPGRTGDGARGEGQARKVLVGVSAEEGGTVEQVLCGGFRGKSADMKHGTFWREGMGWLVQSRLHGGLRITTTIAVIVLADVS